MLLSTLSYVTGPAREIFKSLRWYDQRGESPPRPVPYPGGWRRPNYLFFPSSLASGRAELKLHHQILTPPPRGLQERDAEAGLVQHLLSLHGPSDHALTPGAAHTTGPGAAVRTACSAAWRHWTELGARVGDPGLLGTLEVVAEVLGDGRGQGPQSKKQVAPRPCPGLHQYQTQCSGSPSLSLCAFQVWSSVSFESMSGPRFYWEGSLLHVPSHTSLIALLPLTLPLLLSS